MGLRYILLPLIMFSLPGVSQVVDTMYFDRNWEQTSRSDSHFSRIISIDTSGNFRFYVEDYYPGGQIQMSGTYISIRPDNKDGHFVYWYENGGKQMECNYVDNKLHGEFRDWYANGRKESYQEYSMGLLNGEYSSWREDGSQKLKVRYYNGEKHGNFQSFYPNGQMTRDDFYENDIFIEGHCFFEDGKPIEYFPYVRMPRFPDGRENMRSFVEKELKYPEKAKQNGIEGAVIILFTVNEDGNIENPRVINADRTYFNEEALRVVSKFPQWIPGEVDGVPAPIQISVPIEFRLR